MRSPRSAPRLNVRFPSQEEMDEVELRANDDGLDLQNWIRRLIREEMKDGRLNQEVSELRLIHILKSSYILEHLVDENQIIRAEERAILKLDQLKLNAEHS